MKKTCALVLTVVMLFASVTVFGAYDEELAALLDVNSYKVTYEMSFTLNQPLAILNALDLSPIEKYVDVKALAQSCFSTTEKAAVTTSISSDYKKIQLSMEGESNAPLVINENLKVTADAKSGMWLDMDFTDPAKPVYKMIVKQPYERRYMVMDMTQLPDAGESLSQMQQLFGNEGFLKGVNDLTRTAYQNNATITKAGNKLTIKMDDNGFKQLLLDVFKGTIDLLGASDFADIAQGNGLVLEQLSAYKDKFTLLGKEGITITAEFGVNGKLKSQQTKANICLNVFDIMTVFGQESDTITKENSTIDFSINQTAAYSNVNEPVTVVFPQLTAENSYDPMEAIANSEPNAYVPQFNYYDTDFAGMPVVEDNVIYLPIRSILSAGRFDPVDITWQDGVVTITNKAEVPSFHTLQLQVGSSTVIRDGEACQLQNPVIERDDTTLVPLEFIKTVLHGGYPDIGIYQTDDGIRSFYNFELPNPAYQQ